MGGNVHQKGSQRLRFLPALYTLYNVASYFEDFGGDLHVFAEEQLQCRFKRLQ